MTNSVMTMKPEVEKPQTGIDNRGELAGDLVACLGDTYLLMIKTQAYHWNVVGPLFHSFHLMTEEQYQDLFRAADELAERVRALGHPAPAGIAEMAEASVVKEDKTTGTTTEQMIENLVADHEAVARRFRATVERADASGDVVTADMLTARLQFHEKTIWMLKALLAR